MNPSASLSDGAGMTEATALLTARAAASYLGVSVRSIYEISIPRFILGPRLTRWARADLDAYKASCRREPLPLGRERVAMSTVSLRGSDSTLRDSFRRAGIDPDRMARRVKKKAA